MEAMCQALRGRKSKYFDKRKRLEKRETMRNGHVAREGGRNFPLESNGAKFGGERGKIGGKEKERKEKERRRRREELEAPPSL